LGGMSSRLRTSESVAGSGDAWSAIVVISETTVLGDVEPVERKMGVNWGNDHS
jgi:hypothetical protein